MFDKLIQMSPPLVSVSVGPCTQDISEQMCRILNEYIGCTTWKTPGRGWVHDVIQTEVNGTSRCFHVNLCSLMVMALHTVLTRRLFPVGQISMGLISAGVMTV